MRDDDFEVTGIARFTKLRRKSLANCNKTRKKIVPLYDLMDSAYDAQLIVKRASESLAMSRLPIETIEKRRLSKLLLMK